MIIVDILMSCCDVCSVISAYLGKLQTTGKTLSKSRFLPSSRGEGGTTVGSWFRRRIDDMTPDSLDVPETTEVGIYCDF